MTTIYAKVDVVSKINIASSAELIFKYLTDLNYHFLWNPHLRTISPTITLKSGTIYKSKSWLLGVNISGTNKVTKLVANKELQLENRAGLVHYTVNYQLNELGNRTRLLCTTTVYSEHRGFAFTAPVLRELAKRELQSDLKALKIAVEQELNSQELIK